MLRLDEGEISMTSIQAAQKTMTLVGAVNEALHLILERDERAIVLGEDVGVNGGVFRATEGLFERFGGQRVIDTPLGESGFVGAAIGMAAAGLKPIVEIQFLGFIYPAFEQIVSHAARLRVRSQGRFSVPIVIRAPYGAGVRAPEIHSDSTEAFFVHMPGLKVAVPSTPADAKGLLLAAYEDPDPVIFLEPMRLYRSARGEVPPGWAPVPLGRARLVREGEDVTVIAWGAMVPVAEQASRMAAEAGIDVELLDLRTLYPLDRQAIARSVEKTGRAVIVQEAHDTLGVASHIVAIIQDEAFYAQKAPPRRVSGFDVPVPLMAYEDLYLPTPEKVLAAVREVMAG
ncbi:alpha-ketoacid dehydrogenase subunit beta [Hydrogenibacillus schlegelii]|nr:alpha-ketoacid dehydrogenase subunit beta [Hydrogenibacillus schlegelii]